MAKFNDDTMDGITGALAGVAARFAMEGPATTIYFGWEVAEHVMKLHDDMVRANEEG